MNNSITHVGMDTHKKEHKIAVHYPGQAEIVEFVVQNTARDIKKMAKKIARRAPGKVAFCYEAGVCGFALKRRIEDIGCQCSVIAPSLIPIKPGQRVKTDRKDAVKLLGLFRAGMLTEVAAPDEEQEAARELTRLRETAMINLNRIRHQLLKLLTRHGIVFTDGDHWTQRHIAWLRGAEFTSPMLADVFDSYFTEMLHCKGRLEALGKEVERLAQSEPYREIVGLVRCFHGIDTLTAITVLAEIFEFGRFESPEYLMSYLGLTPSEDSSGDKQSRGSITKAGNRRVRRLLTESSWHYRHRYSPGQALRKRRRGQPQWAIDIADAAGRRLSKRYRYLTNRGKLSCKATVAVARELSGFIWAMLNEYEKRKAS